MYVSNSTGVDLGKLMETATKGLDKDGRDLQKKIEDISNADSVDQQDLLILQFEMGQYNAKLETISTVTKSLQDMLKTLAQRTG